MHRSIVNLEFYNWHQYHNQHLILLTEKESEFLQGNSWFSCITTNNIYVQTSITNRVLHSMANDLWRHVN